MARTLGDPSTDGSQPSASWTDAVDGWLRAVQLGTDLQRRMARTTLSRLDVGPGPIRDAQTEWRRYATHLTELTVDYYRAVAEAARDYGERLAAGRDTGHHEGGRPLPEEDPSGPVIELRGRTGSLLAARFGVENRDPSPAVVTVTAGLARAPDGERFIVPLSVDPALLTIPAGGAVEVSLQLPLLADLFTPDVTYRVPLHVDGPRPTTIEVVVVAEEAVAGGATTTSRSAPGTDAATTDEIAYRVRCPGCDRTFERTTADLRLRPHNTPDGDACPERDGRRVGR